jgi:hypothetical protein
MTLPERPFIGRLTAELLRHPGGMRGAAIEMGVDLDAVGLLVSGGLPTPSQLAAVRAWLERDEPLTDLEVTDFEALAARMSHAEIMQVTSAVLRPARAPQPQPSGSAIQPRRQSGTLAIVAVSAVVSVLLTLVVVLIVTRHNPSSGSPQASSTSTGPAEAEPSSSPAADATPAHSQTPAPRAGGAAIQWGPKQLWITNGGTDLTTDPPLSNAQSSGDPSIGQIYSSGDSISPFAQTPRAVWTSSGQPTASQCRYLDETRIQARQCQWCRGPSFVSSRGTAWSPGSRCSRLTRRI